MPLLFAKPKSSKLERAAKRRRTAHLAAMLRAQVRARDSHRCRSCRRPVTPGHVLAEYRAEVAHIVPRSREPSRINDPENMLTMCAECHAKIHSGELVFVGTKQDTVQIRKPSSE